MIPPTATRTFVVAQPSEDYSIMDLLLVTALDFKGTKWRNGRRR